MARRAFVDSSVWIAYFSARDRLHAEADRALRTGFARRIALVTTNLVLAEVHRWLLFRAGIAAARAAIERIEGSASVAIVFADESHHRTACAWLDRLRDQRISYTDAVSFAVMRAAGCSVAMTFDRDFTIAGFRVWQ